MPWPPKTQKLLLQLIASFSVRVNPVWVGDAPESGHSSSSVGSHCTVTRSENAASCAGAAASGVLAAVVAASGGWSSPRGDT